MAEPTAEMQETTTKTEIPNKREQSITPELLRQAFKSRKFLKNISDLLDHLGDHEAEGSFVVQKEVGKPIILDNNYAPEATSVNDRHESLETWLKFDDKKQVLLFIHSHPRYGITYNPNSVIPEITPSSQDIEVWENIKLRPNNRYTIQGILDENGELFLFQASPDAPQQSYYQQWQRPEGLEKLRTLMELSGIRTEIIKFDVKETSVGITPEELEKVQKFAA